MFNTDTEIFQFIVDDLYRLEDDWTYIILEIELEDGVIGFSGEYITDLGETKWLFEVWEDDRKLSKAFRRLYEIMTQETDKHKWNKAKVTLENGGDFNIKFEWDQEMADETEKFANEYDPRWDDSLTQEEKDKKYIEMVKNGELPDLSKVNNIS